MATYRSSGHRYAQHATDPYHFTPPVPDTSTAHVASPVTGHRQARRPRFGWGVFLLGGAVVLAYAAWVLLGTGGAR